MDQEYNLAGMTSSSYKEDTVDTHIDDDVLIPQFVLTNLYNNPNSLMEYANNELGIATPISESIELALIAEKALFTQDEVIARLKSRLSEAVINLKSFSEFFNDKELLKFLLKKEGVKDDVINELISDLDEVRNKHSDKYTLAWLVVAIKKAIAFDNHQQDSTQATQISDGSTYQEKQSLTLEKSEGIDLLKKILELDLVSEIEKICKNKNVNASALAVRSFLHKFFGIELESDLFIHTYVDKWSGKNQETAGEFIVFFKYWREIHENKDNIKQLTVTHAKSDLQFEMSSLQCETNDNFQDVAELLLKIKMRVVLLHELSTAPFESITEEFFEAQKEDLLEILGEIGAWFKKNTTGKLDEANTIAETKTLLASLQNDIKKLRKIEQPVINKVNSIVDESPGSEVNQLINNNERRLILIDKTSAVLISLLIAEVAGLIFIAFAHTPEATVAYKQNQQLAENLLQPIDQIWFYVRQMLEGK